MKGSIRIIGVPVDLGQKKRGVDMGPGAIRYAGLAKRLINLDYEVKDLGNIKVPVIDMDPVVIKHRFMQEVRARNEQ